MRKFTNFKMLSVPDIGVQIETSCSYTSTQKNDFAQNYDLRVGLVVYELSFVGSADGFSFQNKDDYIVKRINFQFKTINTFKL